MTQNTPFATHTTQNNLYYGKYCKGRKNDNNRALILGQLKIGAIEIAIKL